MEISNSKPPVNLSDAARAKRSADAAESSTAAADRKADVKSEAAPPKDPPKETLNTEGPRGRQVNVAV